MIIGLAGKKGSGKSTVAAQLVHALPDAQVVAFAEPIKQMLLNLGLPYAALYGDQKELPQPILGGKTARHAMQTLGTEWGRQLIDRDIWINAWWSRIKQIEGYVIVDDVRFSDEAQIIQALDGFVFWVDRHTEGGDSHISELGITRKACDGYLNNQGDVADTVEMMINALSGMTEDQIT